MKGGNEAPKGRGITHSPIGEQNVEKCAFQIDAAENLPRMDSALGVLFDGAGGEEPLPIRAAARLPKIAPVGRLRRNLPKTPDSLSAKVNRPYCSNSFAPRSLRY